MTVLKQDPTASRLFQEHAMRIAIVAAGFTPSESDQVAPRHGDLPPLRNHPHAEGQVHLRHAQANGYTLRLSPTRCFNQIEGFGDYGFPESHSPPAFRAFGLCLGLDEVPLSGRVRLRDPQCAADGLLRPRAAWCAMPSDHGVEVRPVDVNVSAWEQYAGAPRFDGALALRLGFRQIVRLPKAEGRGKALIDARGSRLSHPARTLAQEPPRPGRARDPGEGRRLRLPRSSIAGARCGRSMRWMTGQLPLFDPDDGARPAPTDHGRPSHIPADDLTAPLPEHEHGRAGGIEDYDSRSASPCAPIRSKLLRHRLLNHLGVIVPIWPASHRRPMMASRIKVGRPGPGAAAARHRQRRHLHDLGG